MRYFLPAGMAALSLLCEGNASAQGDAINLDALLGELAAVSPTLAGARARIAAARAERLAAGRPQDPMANVELNNWGITETSPLKMVRYGLEQPIPTVGTLRLSKRVADAMLQQAERSADGSVLDIMLQGARAFVMLRMTQGELAINERQQRLVELLSESALARLRSGADTHHDVLQSQSEYLSLQNQHAILEARVVEARSMVNALRNRPPDAPFTAGDAWPANDIALAPEALERAALQRRPELAEMQAMRRERQTMSQLMRREARPMFRVGAWYNDMLMMGDSAGVMVSASLPFFSVPRQRARADAASRGAEAVEHERVAMAAMVRAQVHAAVARYRAALRRERLLRDVLITKAEETLTQAQTSYRSGMMPYASVVQDRRMLEEQQMELVVAEADRALAMADLLRAAGVSSMEEVSQ
jgi:outer membrane protein TolC